MLVASSNFCSMAVVKTHPLIMRAAEKGGKNIAE